MVFVAAETPDDTTPMGVDPLKSQSLAIQLPHGS